MSGSGELNILIWHVHGSWTASFVETGHRCLLPVLPGGGPDGRGRCGRAWPANAIDTTPGELADRPVDLVVLQRPEEIELATAWTRRRPGVDVPAVYVEHNTPPQPATSRHPLSERSDIPVVHVTHFNRLMWDCGTAPTRVIPHGIADPGALYTGELDRIAALINEPVRRGRITGSDLLSEFGRVAPVDVWGIGVDRLADDPSYGASAVHPVADVDQETLHRDMSRRRLYLHTARWTSLGLSLLEAMMLGMPVACVAATEAALTIPGHAGVVSADIDELAAGAARMMRDRDAAAEAGAVAREFALEHFGIKKFLDNWSSLFGQLIG